MSANRFTLRELFNIAGLPLPDTCSDSFDELIGEISTSNNWKEPLSSGMRLMVVFRLESVTSEQLTSFVNDGGLLITYKPQVDINGNPLRMIVLPFKKIQSLWSALGAYLRDLYNIPVIAITGSVGKTTTTNLIEGILSEKYKVFSTKGNLNNCEFIVREMIRALDSTYTLHVQEIGGGGIGIAARSAAMLEPNMFVITNVLPHHMNRYRTIEKVTEDKTSLDAYARPNAVGIVNIDNDELREHRYVHRVVTCGILHKEADYIAENIRQEGAYLRLDIVGKEDRFPVEISIPGKHNAYNVLLAAVTALENGVDKETIQRGLKNYHSDFIRQNLTTISGRTFLIDCFNHSVDSIRMALTFSQEIIVPKGRKKIAILGGENSLGDKAYEVNYNLGLTLDQYDTIDEFIFYGLPPTTDRTKVDFVGDAYAVYEGALHAVKGRKISYCSNREEIARKLAFETVPGDFIMLKGIIHLPLWPAVDIAFGTALTIRSETMIVVYNVSKGQTTGVFYDYVKGVNVTHVPLKQGKLSIPNKIGGQPVFRISSNAFRNNEQINRVEFGKSLKNIGACSFMGCSNIRNLKIPKNVLHLEEYCFADCTQLESVELRAVEHISSKSFSNCNQLQRVYLSSRCQYIAEDAFHNCIGWRIISSEPSEYVEAWAKNHHVPFSVEVSKNPLQKAFNYIKTK